MSFTTIRSAVQNMFTTKSTGVPQECLPDISQKCFALWRIFGLELIRADKALFLDWCNGKSFRTGWALQPFSLRGWREKMAVLRLLTMHRNEFEDCQDTLISRGNRIARVTIQCRKLVVGVLGVPLWVLTNAQPDWCKELMRHSEFLPVPHLRGIQPLPSWRGLGYTKKIGLWQAM